MRPECIVFHPPAFYEHLRLQKSVVDLRVEELIPQPSVERFYVPVLPGAPRLDEELDAFLESVRGLKGMVERLQSQRLSSVKARSRIVEAARAGAFSSAMILPVLDAYESPEHCEFRPRSAWSLYNSASEIMKKQSPARQVEGLKALTDVLVGAN